MKKIAFAFLLPVLLAACGEKSPASVGVSLEKSATKTVDQSQSVGAEKKIDLATKAAVTVKIDGSVVLSQAVKRVCQDAGIKPPYRKKWLAAGDSTLAGKVPSRLAKREHVAAIMAIAAAYEPALGWPDGDDTSFMYRTNAMVNFAQAVAHEAVLKAGVNSLKDPQAAQQAVISAIVSIPAEQLEAIWSAETQASRNRGRPSANFAGSSAPIEYRLGDQVVSIGAEGMHLIANGVTMLGNGKVGGKSVEISVESSLSTGLGRKLALDNKTSDAQSESAKVDAGIKN